MMVYISIISIIIVLLMIRHIGKRLNTLVDIVRSQTKSIEILSKKINKHNVSIAVNEGIDDFMIELMVITTQHIHNGGNKNEIVEFNKIIDKYKSLTTERK